MRILASAGSPDIATVYVAELNQNRIVELVSALETGIPIEEKWVLIISTMLGCPVGCKFCDSGVFYNGKLTFQEMIDQILYLVRTKYPNLSVLSKKFKIQFARMGEPALNLDVLSVLKELPSLINAPGLLPSISTIAPKGANKFFDELIKIKSDLYKGNFQLQFSLHTTNDEQRQWLVPVKKWSLSEIAAYGDEYYQIGDRKITLNFALGKDMELNINKLLNFFDPTKYFIKLTPINPTFNSKINKIETLFVDESSNNQITEDLKAAGYDAMLSIGELEENKIGSNCGQHLLNYLNSGITLENSYTYNLIQK